MDGFRRSSPPFAAGFDESDTGSSDTGPRNKTCNATAAESSWPDRTRAAVGGRPNSHGHDGGPDHAQDHLLGSHHHPGPYCSGHGRAAL